MEIRSYRRVFELERRIYRIDRLRLNPSGVPLRGVAYFLGILALGLAIGQLPVLGAVLGVLPWYLGQLLLPACCAALLTVIAVEGRPFHLAVVALLRHRLGPRRVGGFRRCPRPGTRWRPAPILLIPDGSERRVRRFRYRGPGAIRIGVEHEMQEAGSRGSLEGLVPGRRPTLRVVERQAARTLRKGRVISLPPGVQLFVERAGPRRGP